MTTDILKQEYYVYQSTLFAAKEPYVVKTVLGSCVAVCLFDPHVFLGGINHYMLPWWTGKGLATPKYGNIAIDLLIERVLSLGADRNRLVAKVFGGAEQFGSVNTYAVGRRNIEVAEKQLKQYMIPIISSSTGGSLGRKIMFHTDTGLVEMKVLSPQPAP